MDTKGEVWLSDAARRSQEEGVWLTDKQAVVWLSRYKGMVCCRTLKEWRFVKLNKKKKYLSIIICFIF